MTPEIDLELVQRMATLVRVLADVPKGTPLGQSGYASEARIIYALLHKPIDPDLLIAREVSSEVLMRLGASAEQIAAGDIKAGDRDDAIVVHVAMEALKRGRILGDGA